MSGRANTKSSRLSNRPPPGRVAGRGGIQKRNATPIRADRDGDLVMDSSAGAGAHSTPTIGKNRRGGRGGASGAGSHRRGPPDTASSSTRPRRNGVDPQALHKAVLRGMGGASADVSVKAPRSGNNRQRDSHLQQVRIVGLRSSTASSQKDGGVRDLVAFLERKATDPDAPAREAVRISKNRLEGDDLIVWVRPDDVAKVLRLNNSLFAGTNLQVSRVVHADDSSETPKTTEVLKAFLGRRYDADTKFLNLSHMASDAELVALGLFSTTSRESKFFPVLMKICETTLGSQRARDEAVVSVSLAGNALTDISTVTTLAQTFPSILNLDLSDNQLSSIKSLEGWRWKFKKLNHLILSGNSVETNEPNLKEELLRWFFTLTTINLVAVRTPEEVLASMTITLPLPTLGPLFRDEASIGENFVRQFFLGFDTDRSKLVETYYNDQSTFSLSVNTSAPRAEADINAQVQPAANWEQYIRRSRNLDKIHHLTARMSRLYTGVSAIKDCFTTLPTSRHPDLNNDASKWCIECHAIPGLPDPSGQSAAGLGGLLLTAHGQFSETDVSTDTVVVTRSFDRIFTIGPGSNPIGITILNDLLVLRAYGGSDAWKITDSHTITAAPSAPPVTLPALPTTAIADEQQRKEAIAIELSKATNMTLEYSAMCLEQSAWNLEGALLAFQQVKATLPPEAFVRL